MNCKYCRANCTGAKHDREIALCLGYDPPKTNGDFIRSMSDEELAEFIDAVQSDAYEHGVNETAINDYPNSYGEWAEWLRQECE